MSYSLMLWFIFESKCVLLILGSSPRCVHLDISLHVCCCQMYTLMAKNGRKHVSGDHWRYNVLNVSVTANTEIDVFCIWLVCMNSENNHEYR